MGKSFRKSMIVADAAGLVVACASEVPPAIDDRAQADLALIARHPHKALCGAVGPGRARCHAQIRMTDDASAPYATSAPSGFGPSDLASAYNFASAPSPTGLTVALVDAYARRLVERRHLLLRHQVGQLVRRRGRGRLRQGRRPHVQLAMRRLLLTSMVLLLAPVARGQGTAAAASAPGDESYLAAYKALKPQELDAKKIDALPQQAFRRIEVKQRMRSASFGHSTTLVVPVVEGHPKREFYVEFGKSTNRPGQLFGPFPL
jgi:hypothetical protein